MYKNFKLHLMNYSVSYTDPKKLTATANYALIDGTLPEPNENDPTAYHRLNWSTQVDFPLESKPTEDDINTAVLALEGVSEIAE